MTDYLELLLELWQEDEGEPFVWRRVTVVPPGGTKGEPEQDEVRQTDLREGNRRAAARAYGQAEQPALPWWSAGPAEQLVSLKRAVARGKAEQTAGVRHRVPEDRAGTAGGRTGYGMADVLPGTRRELVGLLDAALERDARRYDGPLELF